LSGPLGLDNNEITPAAIAEIIARQQGREQPEESGSPTQSIQNGNTPLGDIGAAGASGIGSGIGRALAQALFHTDNPDDILVQKGQHLIEDIGGTFGESAARGVVDSIFNRNGNSMMKNMMAGTTNNQSNIPSGIGSALGAALGSEPITREV